MAVTVAMPKAGISVESCVIGSWSKKVGDSVKIGDILFGYETNKAVFECESTAEGVLLAIFFENGDEVPVLTPVCAIGELGEDVSALRPAATVDTGAPAEAASPAKAASPAETMRQAAHPPAGDVGISPRAKKLARQIGVNPAAAGGSGPYGRVIARDIQALAASWGDGMTTGEEPGVSPASASGGDYIDVPFTKIRSVIAASMHESLQNTAQLTHHHSFDASGIVALRAGYKKGGEALGVSGVSLGDMVLFAVSRTLRDHPDLNAHLIGGNTLRKFGGIHLGVAVDTPRGLMVPTVFDADQKSLSAISAEVKRLAELCRSGSISPDLLSGGTFTVSNLGATGVEMFTPILNPPQVGILGVCGITTRVRQGRDGLEAYPAMGLSLTYDHRGVDGAPASRFVQALCKNLEQFSLLLAL